MSNLQRLPLDDDTFGVLLPYVLDKNITDINYFNNQLWVEDLEKGSSRVEDVILSKDFLNKFCVRISNVVSANFNSQSRVVEAETETLRISIIHESSTSKDMGISIRKSTEERRLDGASMISSGYCTSDMIVFLSNCVKAHLNILFCGLPGCGKTEGLKFFTQFIPREEKVITIEDTLEIHYGSLNPGSQCLELKVSDDFSYTEALKAILRQNPRWVLLSEVRSVEVAYLIESFSSGLNGMTTMHTDDVRKIPDRVLNLMKNDIDASRLKNDIYTSINVGVLLRKKQDPITGKVYRFIDQICIFDRDEEKNDNICIMVAENRKIVQNYVIPKNIQTRFDYFLK